MVASTDPGWIHTAFDILTGLFDRVGLQTNVKKTVGMVFHTCRADRVRADKAYTQRMTWGGIQGEAAGACALPGLREGFGKGVTGCVLPHPSRRGKRGVGEGGRRGRQGRQAQDVQDGVFGKSRAKALPS